MNPITRLCLYLAFSISTLLATDSSLLALHIFAGLVLIIVERKHWDEWKKRTAPFWKFFPISGAIYFTLSFLVSDRPVPAIFMDVTTATIRLIVMVSIMTIYTIQSKSGDIIIAVRSIWYKLNLNWRWVEDLLLFFDMTIRFFPSLQEEWRQTERSQMALSINPPRTLMQKTLRVAQFIPDFIILNLSKAETITAVMMMRGYGSTIPRSVYPFIRFSLSDLFWCVGITGALIGVHAFVPV
jgi:energy-coupling factor transporter transmembrane protein EcfT